MTTLHATSTLALSTFSHIETIHSRVRRASRSVRGLQKDRFSHVSGKASLGNHRFDTSARHLDLPAIFPWRKQARQSPRHRGNSSPSTRHQDQSGCKHSGKHPAKWFRFKIRIQDFTGILTRVNSIKAMISTCRNPSRSRSSLYFAMSTKITT